MKITFLNLSCYKLDNSLASVAMLINWFGYYVVVCLGRRASIDFLKGNKELTKEIETEVRKIMAEKLMSGGASSSSPDQYEEEGEGEGEEGDNVEDYEEGEFQQS